MEQHNIDSRFKEGLQNLNRQPSADAWARLQNQMNAPQIMPETAQEAPEENEEKPLIMWWHYAAAAVVLLFLSVGIFRNGSLFNEKTAMPIAVQNPAKKEQPVINTPEVPVTEVTKATKKQVALAETPDAEVPAPAQTATSPKNGSKKDHKSKFVATPKTQLAANPKQVKTKRILNEAKNEPVQNTNLQPEENLIAAVQPEKNETKPALLAGMAIEVIVKKDHTEQALALNQAAPDEEKDSRLKNIFKQVKNLKNFESVDLQAVGLNPDSKVAMGTRNVTQKFSKVLDI